MTAGIFTQNRYTDLHSHYRTHCGSASPMKYRSGVRRTQKIEKKISESHPGSSVWLRPITP